MPESLPMIDASAAVTELEALAEKLGVTVDYDHFTGDGMGSGGLCKVRGQWRLIVERQSSPGEKASVLARALSRFDLESHFISPAVRDLIERVAGTPTGEHQLPASADEPAEPAAGADESAAAAAEPQLSPVERGEGEAAPQ